MKEEDTDTHGALNQHWNEVTARSALPFTKPLSFQVFVSEANNIQLEKKKNNCVKQRQIWEQYVGHLPKEEALKRQASQPWRHSRSAKSLSCHPKLSCGQVSLQTARVVCDRNKSGWKVAQRSPMLFNCWPKTPKSHLKCSWATHRQC